jgi:competence protein ComEC
LPPRARDRWYALLLGALVLLGWNPYSLLDAGFQLSFVAVASIFVLAPRLRRRLEGYPIPAKVAEAVAISTACSIPTAPVAWVDFHAIPLLGVPANLAAAPAVVPLLACAAATAILSPLSGGAAALAAQGSGAAATYLALCAHAAASVPGAQVRSPRAVAVVTAGVLLAAAYAWRNAERAEAGLPAHR